MSDLEKVEYLGEGQVRRLGRIIATPGEEEEFEAAAEEYRAAEQALKDAYREVGRAKDRRKRATEKLAEFASIEMPGFDA